MERRGSFSRTTGATAGVLIDSILCSNAINLLGGDG